MATLIDLQNELFNFVSDDFSTKFNYEQFIKQICDTDIEVVSPLTKGETYFIRRFYGLSNVEDPTYGQAVNIDTVIRNAISAIKLMISNYDIHADKFKSSIPYCVNYMCFIKKILSMYGEDYSLYSRFVENGLYGVLGCLVKDGCEVIGDLPIGVLDLNNRIHVILRNNNIFTLNQLLSMCCSDLSKIDGLGKESLNEIKTALYDKYGLKFIEDILSDYLELIPDRFNGDFKQIFSETEWEAIVRYKILNLNDYLEQPLSLPEKRRIINDNSIKRELLARSGEMTCFFPYGDLDSVCESSILKKRDKRREFTANRYLSLTLQELDLSQFVITMLQRENIYNLLDLVQKSKHEIKSFAGIGPIRFVEIESKLATLGLYFDDDGWLNVNYNVINKIIEIKEKAAIISGQNSDPKIKKIEFI